ncbi:MAG TPA: peptidase C14 [Cyanobacteria bacterium UBA11149]|nr:peptidase C14 [Cyanobacteria bacterium UBA11367]HBE58134.1 peptidase C14 [Cyanobacteria bacterium UBA11366]HBK62914.1 peptidase C14 [Cyanobacteria bacterium UBA11166]HBR75704.1 peptidase C14 [Cyanobacteria bacterium UBA11159]HBS69775.1 peptidase C14 [Cyanobacteria bacterium UBA11153]HBW88455.1 peptidase C14 [Cyanobacteria bacterium UBA11149]HCA95521.1 peptidase C14 [Cyanobacteria bacterium UBA9226]
MSSISRRHFLQFATSTLATLGWSQLNISQQAERYGKVLAQSTPRKLALLVGINKYSRQPLKGCINDLELQRHLLVNCFGFNPKDIYILTDEKANRQGILSAFEEYLIKQAKPGDVVVYHYSGHGSLINDPHPIITEADSKKAGLNGTFVPIDSNLPAGYPDEGGLVKDIMGHTLFLLMSAVKTENFTAILDSCYSGGATRDSRVRSRDGGEKILISPEEKSYQEQWLSRLKWSHGEFVRRYREGVAKGVVLAATNPKQTAMDYQFNGFYAGLFTYLLTQYLWQNSGTPENAIAFTKQQIPTNVDQTPRYDVKLDSGYEEEPIYFINKLSSPANAVVTEVTGNRAKLWLGGVDLGTVDTGTVFTVINGSGKLIFQARNGLVGEAIVEGNVKEGMLLQVN